MAGISSKELTEAIAKEVVRIMMPKFTRMLEEQSRKIIVYNQKYIKKVIQEQFDNFKPVKNIDSDYDDELDLNEISVEKILGRPSKRKVQQPTKQNRPKLNRKDFMTDENFYSSGNAINDLIMNTPIPKQSMIEGADTSYSPTVKPVDAGKITGEDLKNINPANIDYSAFIGNL